MADTTTQTVELQVKATLRQGNAQTTRTLTVANPDVDGTDFRANMSALSAELMTGSLSGVLQPSNWRDGDPLTPPYSTEGVEFALVETTKTTYDIDGTSPAPTFTLTPGGYSSIGEVSQFFNNGAAITVTSDSGSNYDFTELYVPSTNYEVRMTAATGGGMEITIDHPSSIEAIYAAETSEQVTVFTLKLTGEDGQTTTQTFTAPKWTPRVQKV